MGDACNFRHDIGMKGTGKKNRAGVQIVGGVPKPKPKPTMVTCDVCSITLKSNEQKAHVGSKKHKRKLTCLVCKVTTTSLVQLKQHKESKSHKETVKKQAEEQAARASEKALKEEARLARIEEKKAKCQADGVEYVMDDEDKPKQNGKRKRKNKGANSEQAKKQAKLAGPGGEDVVMSGPPPEPVTCEVCKVTATCQANMDMHLAGKKHKLKAAAAAK